MPFEFYQIPVNGQSEAAEALNRRLRGGRIASIRKEFVAAGSDSFWAFCVEYLDGTGPARKDTPAKVSKIDYREVLSEADFAMFARLREVRKGIAKKEAIPAYSVFTNEQLAAIVTQRVDSIAALGKIEGVGQARVEKYGAAILEALALPAQKEAKS